MNAPGTGAFLEDGRGDQDKKFQYPEEGESDARREREMKMEEAKMKSEITA